MSAKKIHNNLKDTVKFEVRRVKKGSRKLYSFLNFIEYQLLMLADL
jgi:hypothetical protein